jgi:hypothetical protein
MPATPAPCPGATVPDEFAILLDCLAEAADPRRARGKVHPLAGVLGLTVLGLMAGCGSLSAISRFGQIHPEVLGPLGLRRSPSVATLSRVLGRVAVADVRAALRAFVQRLLRGRGAEASATTVAVDGKTLRGVREDGDQLHVLQVFAHQGAVALDQVAAAPLRGEPAAAAAWVEAVAAAFPGLRVLTGDAIFADQTLCAALVADRRDYLVRLKKTNSPSTPMPRYSSARTVPPTW